MAKPEELWRLIRAHQDDIVEFARRLVQTPSLSGQEGQVAALVKAEMESLGYDDAWLDGVGNVIGRIDGGDVVRSVVPRLHSLDMEYPKSQKEVINAAL